MRVRALPLLLGFFIIAGTSLETHAEGGSGGFSEADQECVDCHSETKKKIRFEDGSDLAVGLPRTSWRDSIHAEEELECTDCHRGSLAEYPHKKKKYEDRRDFRAKQANSCKKCHYAEFTRVVDSIHYQLLKEGDAEAPTCIDCHGAHDIQLANEHLAAVNKQCARCHEEAAQTYAGSVHGQALEEDGNPDLPLCTECHGAHTIEESGSFQVRVRTHTVCGKCHSDADKMKKYELNPNVLRTFLDDFHGASNQLYVTAANRVTSSDPKQKTVATCTDCHGYHEVQALRATAAESKTESKQAIQARVIESCRQCHEGVPLAFADAWLSHSEPSWQTTPIVATVKWVYRILIPLIIAGLVLHILLHLWRLRMHR